MDTAARQRHRQRLLDLRAEILAEGDIEPEAARDDPSAVGTSEFADAIIAKMEKVAA